LLELLDLLCSLLDLDVLRGQRVSGLVLLLQGVLDLLLGLQKARVDLVALRDGLLEVPIALLDSRQ
jgi:hypothetical protein